MNELSKKSEEAEKAVKEKLDMLYSYPKELRLKAEIEQLRDRLHEIASLCQTDANDFIAEMNCSPELSTFKSQIFEKADMFGLDLNKVLEYCDRFYKMDSDRREI